MKKHRTLIIGITALAVTLVIIGVHGAWAAMMAGVYWQRVYAGSLDGTTHKALYWGGKNWDKPTFVDIDADGDHDFFMGERDGYIIHYRNDGSASAPDWTFVSEHYNDIDVGLDSTPAFTDIDGDGDYDLFIGQGNGRITYYRNDGSPTSPIWRFESDNYASIQVDDNSAPVFVDIDDDGDYDLFIGDDGGRISYYRNDGTPTTPSWILVTNEYESIDIGERSLPAFADIDGDSDYDMFIGGGMGESILRYYRNDGTSTSPTWSFVTNNYNSISQSSALAPTFVDVDSDGDQDLFVGHHWGNIIFYRNDGTPTLTNWTYITDDYFPLDWQGNTAPGFADLDTDGDMDMLLGHVLGSVYFYRNDGDSTRPEWTYMSPAVVLPWNNNNHPHAYPTLVDIDADGDLDLFVGEGNWDDGGGNIHYYRNDGTPQAPTWTSVTDIYESIDVGSYSVPTFVDLDGDGDYDLFIGEEDGNLNFYRNDGNATSPAWTLVTESYANIGVGDFSAPVFHDVDGDSDYDLFVGELDGNINFYRNDGNTTSPIWTFVTQAYAGLDVGWHSVPTFADLDGDGHGDLLIGELDGGLDYYRYRERHPTSLTLGSSLDDSVEPLAYVDYTLAVDAGERLLIQVTPQSGIGQIRLYGKRDGFPSSTQYDFQAAEPTVRGTYELLIAPTQTGTYYFGLFGQDIIGLQGNYAIVARTLDRYLSNVQPRSTGNVGEVVLYLQGLGFVEGMGVELRRSGSPTLVADEVMQLSATEISAHFSFSGETLGLYNVVGIWPGGPQEELPSAFEVHTGQIGPQLEASLDAPDLVRPDRTFTIWLDYANTGDSGMVAPLFIVSSPDGVPLRLSDHEAFADKPAQVMGVNLEGYAGLLPPGASGRIPLYFHVPSDTGAHEMLDFDLAIMTSDTQPIDWDEVEDEVRPPDVDPEVWDVLWPSLTAQIGHTWGDYRQALADNAGYLSSLGRTVYSVRELFRFEVRKALGMNPRALLAGQIDAYAPAPGLPLQFGRVFLGSLEGRFYLGPLGRGWSHNFDIFLEEHSNGDILLHWPGSFTRLFTSNGDGTYAALPGDYGTLTCNGNIFDLTEKDRRVYRFRADRRLDYVEEPNGNRITAAYNGSGQLIGIQHSNGDSFTLAYNAYGRISHHTDHTGRVTQYNYDASGEHLLTVTAPGSRVTTYTYETPTGQPTDHALRSITYPDNTHQYYTYDSLGRLSEEQLDGGAERISYTYDALDRVHVTDASGETAIISPDEHGRPAKVRDALGRELSQEYSPEFNLSQLTDPAGQPHEFDYDLLGNVIGTENPLGHQVKLGYDTRFSQIALVQDAQGNQSTFDYDDAGNLTTLSYPDGSQETITYDAAGNPTGYTSRSGDQITYSYNARGQLLRKDYPDGFWVTYTYDAAGNMTTASDASGTITMIYEANTDRLAKITYPSGRYFEFSYNDAGQRTQRLDQDGHELNYDYDAAGRLLRLYDEHGADMISYEYDDNGRLSRESKGNGTYTTYEYDAAGQLIHMINYAPDDSVQSRFDYTYDANGNRTSMTTLAGTTTYDYDPIGQLTAVTYPGGRHATYEYDAVGNRVTVTDNSTPTTYTTNNLNQYTQVGSATYTYDDNGNMTSKTDAGGTTTYEYDYANRLIRVVAPGSDTWEYTYDALGNRVAVTHNGVVIRYVHDPIGLVDVAAEYDGSGSLVAQYIHGLGLVARIDAAGNPAYYAFDAIGHTRQLTDDTGVVANTYDYTPFGIPLQADETIPNPLRYAGKFGVMEEGNEMIFMRARYYDSSLGRFVSPDPIEFGGQEINLYTYVANCPVNYVDPSGLRSLAIDNVKEYWSNWWKNFKENCRNWWWLVKNVPYEAWPDSYRDFNRDFFLDGIEALVGALPGGATIPLEIIDTYFPENITSDDPNEKVGPAGVGGQHLVRVEDELHYVIYFENKPEAGAPAQEVFITDNLDPDLDWSTFRLTEVTWGDQTIAVPENTVGFYTRHTVGDYRTAVEKSWWVDVEMELDHGSGQVQWIFRTLDPQTGGLPFDPLAGFLPPNYDTGRGEGHVAFTIRPYAGSPDGTILTNKASIVFDTNEPIVTNEVANTIGQLKTYLPIILRSYP